VAADTQTPAEALPAHVQLIQMGNAFWVSRLVYAAAKLGLADQLEGGPKSAAELSDATNTHAPSLHRLLRTLASLGILTERDAQRFALTPLGEALKTGAPGGARSSVLTFGSEWQSGAWKEIMHSLETGESGMEKAWNMPLFDHLAQHPEEAALFSEAMVGFHGDEPPAVAAAYDFSQFETIVDLGGATGNLLSAILTRHARLCGVLFDRAHVVNEAPAFLAKRGVAERVNIVAGDFFETVPGGGDAYLLSHIIHDWNEEQCLTILGHCRKVMKPSSRLIIIESVLPDGDTPHPGKLLDMVMLVLTGGQERTEAEYSALLDKAGFRLTSVVDTASAVSLVEAVPA
jgi:hypothetical protein